jgi:hypothetical protein
LPPDRSSARFKNRRAGSNVLSPPHSDEEAHQLHDLVPTQAIEPVDQSGRRWVQGQIASPDWTRAAHFGQGDTPSGMRYRVYVLSTSTALPIGELTKQTDSPQESPAITVTLKK